MPKNERYFSVKLPVPANVPDIHTLIKLAAIKKDVPVGRWILDAVLAKLEKELRDERKSTRGKRES